MASHNKRPARQTAARAKASARGSRYVSSPIDACEEAAARIETMIHMIYRHECSGASAEQYGGYDLSIICEALQNVQRTLRDAVKHAVTAPSSKEVQ